MRKMILILWLIDPMLAYSQDPSGQTAGRIEALAETTESEPENDEIQLLLDHLLYRPLTINSTTEKDLGELGFLSPLQISTFLQYQKLFGPIRNKYELQAIPEWDQETIHKILPFISFIESGEESRLAKKIIKNGQHQFLIRTSNSLEKAKGYERDSSGKSRYVGDPYRLMYRYTYQFKQQLWWGFTGEKDGGEKLFDFSSFHFFLRRNGLLKTIAIGDYTVNIGQGLMHWQGLAFAKSSETMGVYHQDNLLQPYRSAGEWNFHRGLAAQFQYRRWEATAFVSRRKLSANLVLDSSGQDGFSSISQSGYHRTQGELEDRNSLLEYSYGGTLQFKTRQLRIGAGFINYKYSLPAVPENSAYNLYAIRGKDWFNSGINYSYIIRNMFLFGEAASCRSGWAVIQGLVMSLHHKADFSMVYRNIQPGYQALYARSFTENSKVNNETGWYTAIKISLFPEWQFQAYADFFRFPWLKFRADAPGTGQEYFLQLAWVRRKKWTVYMRYRNAAKPGNFAGEFLNEPVAVLQANIRLHAERIISPLLVVSARLDKVWYQQSGNKEAGTAFYLDGRYQVRKPSLVFAARAQYFYTDGYNSRIYAYERDLLYSFSIPAFYDQGFRYYAQIQGKPARFGNRIKMRAQWWLRWSQSIFGDGHIIGSGNDLVNGHKKSDWKFQVMLGW